MWALNVMRYFWKDLSSNFARNRCHINGFFISTSLTRPHAADTVMYILNSHFHYQIILNHYHDRFVDVNPCDYVWWSHFRIMSVAVIIEILQIWKAKWIFTSNIGASVVGWTVQEFLCLYAMLLRWMTDILCTFWNSVKNNGGHTEHLHHKF